MADLDAIFLDFDGVILESLDIKTRAFRDLFRHYPQHLDAILSHHVENMGVSRYQKFKWIYSELIHRPLAPEEMSRLDQEFSNLVFDAILRCPMVVGAKEFLEKFNRHLSLFVVSATPEAELKRIVAARRLNHFFRDVRGAPPQKAEILSELLVRHRLDAGRCLFIGDAMADARAAAINGIAFVQRLTVHDPSPFRFGELAAVQDLIGLTSWLECECSSLR